jgi:hypothetical protein
MNKWIELQTLQTGLNRMEQKDRFYVAIVEGEQPH